MTNPVRILNLNTGRFIAEHPSVEVSEKAIMTGSVQLDTDNKYAIVTVHKCFAPAITFRDVTSEMLNTDPPKPAVKKEIPKEPAPKEEEVEKEEEPQEDPVEEVPELGTAGDEQPANIEDLDQNELQKTQLELDDIEKDFDS